MCNYYDFGVTSLASRSLLCCEEQLTNGGILQMWGLGDNHQVTEWLLQRTSKELFPDSWDLTEASCREAILATQWLLASYIVKNLSHACNPSQGPLQSQSVAGPTPLNHQNCKLNEPYVFVKLAYLSNFITVTQTDKYSLVIVSQEVELQFFHTNCLFHEYLVTSYF